MLVVFRVFSGWRLHAQPVHGTTDTGVIWQILNWPDGGDSRALVVDVAAAGITNVSRSDGVDARFQLVQWQTAAVAQHLAANVLADGRSSVQLQQHRRLQQILGTGHLRLGHRLAQTHPLALDVVQHVLERKCPNYNRESFICRRKKLPSKCA